MLFAVAVAVPVTVMTSAGAGAVVVVGTALVDGVVEAAGVFGGLVFGCGLFVVPLATLRLPTAAVCFDADLDVRLLMMISSTTMPATIHGQRLRFFGGWARRRSRG